MKKIYAILIVFVLTLSLETRAAYVQNQPYQITQPDGTEINCFVSGDEFFNWLHDADGYTIIQAENGYFYYAVKDKDRIIPSEYLVESVNPVVTTGLKPWVKISKQEYQRRKQSFEVDNHRSTLAPHEGTFNNLAIYIRFADDSEFSETRQYYDDIFNLGSGSSVKSYYNEVTYNILDVNTSHYPECAMTTNLSYTDPHQRSYFEPYNATTNPGGYNGETERRYREHALLRDAVNWINTNSPIPSGLNIDGDNDGQVDNVAFIIRGDNGAWASLLWAHRWVLYTYDVYINGKQVWDYTFQPETQVNVRTLCHEFFHALGAPDLYHYNDGGLEIAPVGPWDLMESGGGHMGAYMKWKYSNNTWISSIPEITASGTYTLNPLSSSTNNCYKIASPNSSSQYFMVEYRQSTGTFESNLPGSGLLVYRIDPAYNGNADGPPDEVYIYRPNGTTTTNGDIEDAYFSQQSGRLAINNGTNPSSFLQNGNPGGLNIFDVTASGSTISFTVGLSSVEDPGSFTATAISESQINLQWMLNTSQNNVMLAFNTTNTFGSPSDGTSYSPGNTINGGGTVLYAGSGLDYQHINLETGTMYYYKIWSYDGVVAYSNGASASAHTNCGSQSLPFSESFNGMTEIPVCWDQQISGSNVTANWSVSPTTFAGGNTGELMSTWQEVDPGINRLILPAFNTTGMSALNLSFRHKLDAYGTGVTLKVQSSSDGNTWTNEAWVIECGSSDIGPEEINTSITSNLNSPNTYIAFAVEGNLFQYDFWYVDDISVTNASVQSYTISTSSNPAQGGTTTGGGVYDEGTQLTVTAQANTGYTFTNWTENGNVVSTNASYTFTVNNNRTLIANFTPINYTISASVNPTNSGTITGSGTYTYGSQATLLATPNFGYTFSDWTENGNVVSTSASYSFVVDGNRTLVANFTQEVIEYTITTASSPTNGGTTEGGGTYEAGQTVTLIATPATDWNFVEWTEDGTAVSNSTTYSFTAQSDRNLVANFAMEQFEVTLLVNPTNAGTVTGAGWYDTGSTATVTASPSTGYNFVAWTVNGNVVSTQTNYSFTITSDLTLTAEFELQSFTIQTTSNPAEGGTTTGAGTYNYGETAELKATANQDYAFVDWKENGNTLSTNPQISFIVNVDRELVAHFKLSVGIVGLSKPECKLYPNPTRGGFIIETNDLVGKIVNVNISGITGNVVMDIKQPLPTYSFNIDLNAQAESVYFVKIITDKGHCIIKKLILKK